MIPVPPMLETHLAGEVTSHCFAWIVTRTDDVKLGFTDHDRVLPVEGVDCEPMTGLSGSEASTQLGLAVAGGEVEGVLSSVRVSDTDIEHGRYDGARVEVWLVNWSEPAQRMMLRRWTVGKITRSGRQFIMELKGAAAAFDAICGRRVLRQCNAELGDARCGVSTANPPIAATATVVSANGNELSVSGLSSYAGGWFTEGYLTWTSGDNLGRVFRITAHNGAMLQLNEPPLLAVQAGDTFRVIAGCDKSYATCKAKFGNGINFRGFPHLPGNDAAYAYVSGSNEYDGSALVP